MYAESITRMVKVFALLLLLPAVFMVRRLQLQVNVEEVLSESVLAVLFLTALLAGSAALLFSTMAAVHHLNQQR